VFGLPDAAGKGTPGYSNFFPRGKMPLDPSTSDNTGPLGTPDLMPSPSSDDEKIQENKTLAFLVYKEVWDEFNKWKVEDCRQQLRLLEQPLPPPNVAESTKRLASAFRTDLDGSEPGDVEIIYICDMEDDIPFDMSNATVLTCEDVSLKLPLDFKPHPPYESCTPSVQTIALRETSAAYEEITVAPFIPYADSDDPNWNIRRYLKQFEGFAWERLTDPDGKRFHLFFELVHAGSLIDSGGDSIRGSAPLAFRTRAVAGRYRCHGRPAQVASVQSVWFDLPDDTAVRWIAAVLMFPPH
jgi:hypothetical protein